MNRRGGRRGLTGCSGQTPTLTACPVVRGHDASVCLMYFTMKVSSLLPGVLLLLLSSVRDQLVGAKKPEEEVSPEVVGSHLRSLWKLRMRDYLLKGKGGPVTGRQKMSP